MVTAACPRHLTMEILGNFSVRNLTDMLLDDSLKSVFELSETLAAVLGILQIVLGVAFNVLLLVSLLGDKELRRDVRNMLAANLAVADLFAAGVLQPVEVSLEMRGDWSLGCYPHIVFQLLYFFAFSFVSAWGLVCMDSLLLARVCRPDMPLTSFLSSAVTTSISAWKRRLDRAVVVTILALPWVLSVVVIAPVVFTGLHQFHSTVWSNHWCDLIFVRWASLALNILFFFLPAFLALLLLTISACLSCCRRRRRGFGNITSSVPPAGESRWAGPQDRPLAYLVANVVTFVLMGPRHVLSMLSQHAGLSLMSHVPSWVLINDVFQWLSETKPVCLPLVWILFLPEVRGRARQLLTSALRSVRRVKDTPRFDPSVSYRNLDP